MQIRLDQGHKSTNVGFELRASESDTLSLGLRHRSRALIDVLQMQKLLLVAFDVTLKPFPYVFWVIIIVRSETLQSNDAIFYDIKSFR